MELDRTVHRGDPGKPVVIFIHGLGMDKNFWINPLETKILARNVPMKVFAARRPRTRAIRKTRRLTVGTIPGKIDNLWTSLERQGFNLLCWSQRRPVGPIGAAVEELDEIINQVRLLFPGEKIALIGHSRGGLIARKFMEKKTPELRALITLSTPHHGSTLSLVGKYISPLTSFFKSILPRSAEGTISEVMKNVNDLLQGNGLKELMPGSAFYKGLKDPKWKGVCYASFGGRKTKLFTLYTWKREQGRMSPKPLVAVPDGLLTVLPELIIPEEIIPGRGDVMVTAKSSRLPWADRHHIVSANHISISWNRYVMRSVAEILGKI